MDPNDLNAMLAALQGVQLTPRAVQALMGQIPVAQGDDLSNNIEDRRNDSTLSKIWASIPGPSLDELKQAFQHPLTPRQEYYDAPGAAEPSGPLAYAAGYGDLVASGGRYPPQFRFGSEARNRLYPIE